MSTSVEKIKERLGIVEVVSAYLKLERAGNSFKAKCPFHNEKTASFFVSPDRGTYYCFGCGAKGDIFTFVEEFEGVEFREALKSLALKAGVELVPEKKEKRDETERLQNLLEFAAKFFEKNLAANKDVLAYLKKRGLSEETIKTWGIGYAENDWRTLYEHLSVSGFDAKSMLAVGLIKKSEKGGGEPYYDTFRARIIFPLFDSGGRVVGFSGRIFVDDGKSPKYLNSPETQFFSKSEFLYGLNKAKVAIRKQNYALVVEGQIDLIMAHQAGHVNAVATSGTAFSDRHIKRLKNLSSRIMFAFDGDSAGFLATERSAHLALSLGMEVKVAPLPKGEDPASLILKDPKIWRQTLSNSKHIIDFYTDSLISSVSDKRSLSRQVKEKVLPFVLMVQSAIERAHFVKNISEKTGIKEEAIWDDLKSMPAPKIGESMPARAGDLSGKGAALAPDFAATPRFPDQRIARSALGFLFWQESVKKPAIKKGEIRKRLAEILGKEKLKDLEESLEEEKEKLIFEAEQYYRESAPEQQIKELLLRLEEEGLRDELAETIISLEKAEQEKKSALSKSFLLKCHEIGKKLAALKQKR